MVVWLGLTNNTQNIGPLVSGVIDTSDPNHPVEVYYGRPEFLSLSDMAFDLGVRIYDEDKIQVFPAPELGLGSKITIQRAMPIVVDDAGVVSIARTWQKQVREFLGDQNIILGDKDRINPDINTWLRSQMRLTITRVAETELKEEESISYKTLTRDDPTMEKGDSKVEKQGKNGLKVKTFLVRRENGVEVSRELLKEEVTLQPENKIVRVGTKIVELGRGTATWYDWISGLTAAHNTLPMGTMVRVTNLNNGKSVVVKIVDRGIFSSAIIDLSADAFSQIADLGQGIIPVRLTKE